jgi:hypothetical protein
VGVTAEVLVTTEVRVVELVASLEVVSASLEVVSTAEVLAGVLAGGVLTGVLLAGGAPEPSTSNWGEKFLELSLLSTMRMAYVSVGLCKVSQLQMHGLKAHSHVLIQGEGEAVARGLGGQGQEGLELARGTVVQGDGAAVLTARVPEKRYMLVRTRDGVGVAAEVTHLSSKGSPATTL